MPQARKSIVLLRMQIRRKIEKARANFSQIDKVVIVISAAAGDCEPHTVAGSLVKWSACGPYAV